jgi:cytochrome c oxidase subunit 4
VGILVSVAVFDPMNSGVPKVEMETHIVPKSTYFKIFVCLAVLMVVTVGAAEIHLGYFNTPIAMLIALAKATLIVLFFMHVRYASPLVRVFAAGGFVWLAIMFLFTFAEVLTRH